VALNKYTIMKRIAIALVVFFYSSCSTPEVHDTVVMDKEIRIVRAGRMGATIVDTNYYIHTYDLVNHVSRRLRVSPHMFYKMQMRDTIQLASE